MELQAKYDCIMGKSRHFTVGKLGDKISGGFYIQLGTEVPKEITITFKSKDEEAK